MGEVAGMQKHRHCHGQIEGACTLGSAVSAVLVWEGVRGRGDPSPHLRSCWPQLSCWNERHSWQKIDHLSSVIPSVESVLYTIFYIDVNIYDKYREGGCALNQS